jgi:hypothetical protein
MRPIIPRELDAMSRADATKKAAAQWRPHFIHIRT